jgi:hypothetical protein
MTKLNDDPVNDSRSIPLPEQRVRSLPVYSAGGNESRWLGEAPPYQGGNENGMTGDIKVAYPNSY